MLFFTWLSTNYWERIYVVFLSVTLDHFLTKESANIDWEDKKTNQETRQI